MFHLDTQIHFSDLLICGGGIVAAWKIFIGSRDSRRDANANLQGVNRLLELHGLKLDAQDKTIGEHTTQLARHEYEFQERRRVRRRPLNT